MLKQLMPDRLHYAWIVAGITFIPDSEVELQDQRISCGIFYRRIKLRRSCWRPM